MRTIKFRGKDVYTGQWRYGDLIHYQKVTATGWTPRIMADRHGTMDRQEGTIF